MPSSPKNNLVFVYGTLRQGGQYHHLLKEASYIAHTQTLPNYSLVDVGTYPGLLKSGHTAVKGDIYAVDDKTFKLLDLLEDRPSLYEREQITFENGQKAWVYFLQPHLAKGLRIIPSGDYFDHSK